jgi:tetratricopeptide (TPR) repeat protein
LINGVVIGLTLTALMLTSSSRVAATSSTAKLPPELTALRDQGRKLYDAGRYYDARAVFLHGSERARQLGLPGPAASNLASAGTCLYVSRNFRGALKDYELARKLAQESGSLTALAAAENNMASLYLHMGEYLKALQVSTDALTHPEGRAEPAIHGKLIFQRAIALAELDRFPEAEPVYRRAIEELTDQNDLDSVARIKGELGAKYLKAGRLDEAEAVLSEALGIVRIHRLNASSNILTSLAELKSKRGDIRSATTLFEAALSAPPNISPVWMIRSSRGRFRLDHGDVAGALSDFREARRAALEMRADMVPADQDRVYLESGLSSVIEGLVDAGNELARQTGDGRILKETFDAAEQDRMWSLRAMVPSPNDWRTRLPDHYWELLAQYQSLARTSASGRPPSSTRRIEDLKQELQRIEIGAAGESAEPAGGEESALGHAQRVLPEDSVLLSFLLTKNSAWLWAVDRGHVGVFLLPATEKIRADAAAFESAVRAGDLRSAAAAETWRDLFGGIPASYLNHSRWLIEPDDPLNHLPLAALRDNSGKLAVERASIQTIPGALLLEKAEISANAPFLGVGDPIYNKADSRYRAVSHKDADLTLPRLPGTKGEIEACSKAWGGGSSRLLTGADANAANVTSALRGSAPIMHFATHVITAPGEFRSGLIALSLDASGAMDLLGPEEILARPVSSSLVVMNGCHSAQGKVLASAGIMGLSRAWIGAGAKAVISTAWDIPDNTAETLMTDFYRALHAAPERGASAALSTAQRNAILRGEGQWAAYSLLSRIP